jgi:hypothetical protein
MLKRSWRSLALAALLATGGCYPTVHEPLRVGTLTDAAPLALGFRVGVTTLGEARGTLERERFTGVVSDGYARDSGARLEVLGADYQSRVHVFRGGTYERSLPLATRGLPPYGMALRLAKDGSRDVLLVLYRDPLARHEEPPTLLSFAVESDGLTPLGRAPLASLVAHHGGMSSPMLIGNDMGEGVMLVARDRNGELWNASYLLRLDGSAMRLEPKPITEALRCSCVRAYAAGTPVIQ